MLLLSRSDGRNDYEASWTLPTDQQDETGKQGMGRSDSIWNEMNVIGVTEGIYNDTVAISKESQYYTPEIVAALQECFINIIGTDEGKAIFDVYSHTGYAKATDADYDGARAALQAVAEEFSPSRFQPNNDQGNKAPRVNGALFRYISLIGTSTSPLFYLNFRKKRVAA